MRSRAILICGLLFLWPMVRGNFFVAFLGEEPALLLQLLPYAAIALASALLALTPPVRARLAAGSRASCAPALVTGGLAALAALVRLAGAPAGAGLPATILWGSSCAPCFCLLVVGWGSEALSRGKDSRVETDLALSFLLSLPLTQLAQAAGLEFVLCALCPVLSAALLRLASSPLDGRPSAGLDAPASLVAPSADRALVPRAGAPVPAFLAILAITLAVCVLVGVINRPVSAFDDPGLFQLLCTAALAAVALAEAARSKPGVVRLSASLCCLLFALMAGTLAASLLDGEAAQAGRALTVACRRVLWLLLFLAVLGRGRSSSPQRSVYELAFLYAGCHGVSRLATAVVRELVGAEGVAHPAGGALLMAGMLAVLVIGFAIAMGYAVARGRALAQAGSGESGTAGMGTGVRGVAGGSPLAAASSLVAQAELVPSSLGEKAAAGPVVGGSTEGVGSERVAGTVSGERPGTVASPAGSSATAAAAAMQSALQTIEAAGDLRHDACLAIAARLSLTERERDVMEWLSRGDTVRHIAQEHVLSENTVRSHCKTLYRKARVHSRQEIIDLVGAEMEGLGEKTSDARDA